MMHRDFIDLHKLNEETWFSYYKRRSINYGIPIIIDEKEHFINIENVNKTLYKDCYKCSYSVLKNNIVKCLYNQLNFRTYVLSTENKLYSFGRTGKPIQLKYFDDIRNIEKSTRGNLFFIRNNNNLYKIDRFLTSILLSCDVINIFRSHIDNVILYYSMESGTYSISNNEDDTIIKVFDEPVLSWLKMGKFDFFITRGYELNERYFDGDKYEYYNLKLKAKQLSYINHENFAILGTDGFIRIYNHEDKMYKIDIPNVDSLSEDSFLTKNGDLYFFDENLKAVLMDTNVVNIGNFSRKEAFGCYIKRYI